MQDYKINEIRQCFNMSFEEYLGVTPRIKRHLDAFAKEWAENMAKSMRRQEEAGAAYQHQLHNYRKANIEAEGYQDPRNAVGGALDMMDFENQLGV